MQAYFCPHCHRRIDPPAFIKQVKMEGGGKIVVKCGNCKTGKIIIKPGA